MPEDQTPADQPPQRPGDDAPDADAAEPVGQPDGSADQSSSEPSSSEPSSSESSAGDGPPPASSSEPAAADGGGDAEDGDSAAAAALRAAREALASIQADADSAGAASGAPQGGGRDPQGPGHGGADRVSNDTMAELMREAAEQQERQAGAAPSGSRPLELPAFSMSSLDGAPQGIDMLADVELDVRIELGRTRMLVEDVLRLVEGAVVELDKLAGDPVDVFVNNRLVARGEVLVLNDNFCIRVNEIIDATGEQDDGQGDSDG